MMDFGLSDEQKLIIDVTRHFTEKELFPYEEEVERSGRVPPELVEQIKTRSIAAGIYAANMPAEYGGAGLDPLTLALVERELGAASYALQYIVARPVQHPPSLPGRAGRALPAPHQSGASGSTAWP